MLDLQSNFNSFNIADACYSKGKANNVVSMSMMYENMTEDHVSKEQHTSDFKSQNECPEGSTPDDVSQQSTTETPRGIANSAQSSYKPIYVRTNSGVAKLITGINDDLVNVSWYEPRQSEPADLFSGQDAQISERYKHYDARLASFTSPRWPPNVPVPADELARAGWYFTGVTDRVKCPWCHGCVYNWVDGDTALGEHKRHYSQCEFVKEHIAKAFQKPHLSSKASVRSKPPLVTGDICRQNSAVQAVQELEIYSDGIIKQAVQLLLVNKRKLGSFASQYLLLPPQILLQLVL